MNDTETTTSSKRAEANRRNAQKSTGPRTAEGKARSRFNAVTHGMRAKTDVLPGEDPDIFQQRLDRWTADLKPADEVETFLVGRAVRLSWQLERADRALDDRDAEALAARRAERADEVLALGRRLFWDPRGPDLFFPHWTQPGFLPRRISWSGQVDDPDDPARLLSRLESTATGCAWLLDRWAELRAVLEEGAAWQPPERFRAVRLLGRQPLDLLADGRVLTVYLAGTVTGTAEAQEFADVVAELNAEERDRFAARLRERVRGRGRPADAGAARAELLELVAIEEARLEGVLAGHLEESPGEAGGFDAGNDGERLRRYQQACDRGLLRVLESLRKRQRERAGGSPRGPARPGPDRGGASDPSSRLAALLELAAAARAANATNQANDPSRRPAGGPSASPIAPEPSLADDGRPPARPGDANDAPTPAPASATNEANDPGRLRPTWSAALLPLLLWVGFAASGGGFPPDFAPRGHRATADVARSRERGPSQRRIPGREAPIPPSPTDLPTPDPAVRHAGFERIDFTYSDAIRKIE